MGATSSRSSDPVVRVLDFESTTLESDPPTPHLPAKTSDVAVAVRPPLGAVSCNNAANAPSTELVKGGAAAVKGGAAISDGFLIPARPVRATGAGTIPAPPPLSESNTILPAPLPLSVRKVRTGTAHLSSPGPPPTPSVTGVTLTACKDESERKAAIAALRGEAVEAAVAEGLALAAASAAQAGRPLDIEQLKVRHGGSRL